MRTIHPSRIISHESIGPRIFLLTVSAPPIATAAKPGQFCMLAPVPRSQSTDPLLKRPLSIHNVNGNSVSFLYKCVGHGTELLSQRRPEEHIELIGPLGHGFALDKTNYILVGGGMGIAPLLFTALMLASNNKKSKIVLGARTAAELPKQIINAFQKVTAELYLMTEDGSLGEKGLVTAGLSRILTQKTTDLILACGPWPMLRAIHTLSQKANIPCQVSLEAHMACGIGACLGCAIKAQKGDYLHVCKDGPVMDSTLVDWG